jgi:hypothetical protein
MDTMRIDLLNPKAAKLIEDLADLKLIAIHKPTENDFSELVERLRSKAEFAPSLEEITREVELVRAKRYAR